MSAAEYVDAQGSLPYCKGCGHGIVLRALGEALETLAIPPADIAIVTDIGCVGLADERITGPHTIHTTHGRSAAFAAGLSLADSVLGAGRLKTIVMVGDGGAMLGINHLVSSALLNPDVTVIVHDNFLFGMTGGQNSAFSPTDFVTATTKGGNTLPPLDLARILLACRAPFVARKIAGDRDLAEVLTRAIVHPGFALVEVLELCTAYGVKWNEMTRSSLETIALEAGYELGVLRDEARPRFADVYKRLAPVPAAAPAPARAFASGLDRPVGVVIAGTAGEHIQTAATLLARAAMKCGLHATQKNDNPVTQGTGFSVSEVILSPDEILFTGIERPDAIVVVSADGAREAERAGRFAAATEATLVVADDGIDLPAGRGAARRLPLRREHGPKGAALAGVRALIEMTEMLPAEALDAAVADRFGPAAKTDASRDTGADAVPLQA
jgi:pyruvate/2-oxoacid:ferredoxin oxidoreductase beta subunit/Pyruvate/2-oxoacid:ferredoxin oxidoreductase gamma subunit